MMNTFVINFNMRDINDWKKLIEKLREAVLKSNNKLLEEQVVNSSDINFILDKFTIYTKNEDYYDDVSIYNIDLSVKCRTQKMMDKLLQTLV